MASLTYQMPNKNVSTLCDTEAEEEDKHDDIEAVGSCCQCLIADLVDEISDDNL